MSTDYAALLEVADQAAKNAHVPYSKFHVGAALVAEDGTVFPGCNVENDTYGRTTCAPPTAVFSAVAAGHKRFKAIAIVQHANDEPCWPCGACRQVLAEFNPDMDVIFREGSGVRVTKLHELLPHCFDAARLKVK
jgi:cytidine deaminase